MFDLFWLPNFIKIMHISILRPNLPKLLISGQDPQFQISYLWLTNLACSWSAKFHSIENIFHSIGTKLSWNEKIDTCFNVECVLLGRNFDFFGGYCSFPLLVWTENSLLQRIFIRKQRMFLMLSVIYVVSK